MVRRDLLLALLLIQGSLLWLGLPMPAWAQGPTIERIEPNPGFAGDPATIVGHGFDPSSATNNLILFAGLTFPATAVDAAGTRLTFTVPEVPSEGPITITSLAPLVPPVGGGTLTITGENFPGAPTPLTVTVRNLTSNQVPFSSGGATWVAVTVLTRFDTPLFLELGRGATFPFLATVTGPSSLVVTVPPLLSLAPPPDPAAIGRDGLSLSPAGFRVGFTRLVVKFFNGDRGLFGDLAFLDLFSFFPQLVLSDVALFSPEPPFLRRLPAPIQIGQTVSAALSQPREFHHFEFQGQAGQVVTVTAHGQEGLDPEVFLFGPGPFNFPFEIPPLVVGDDDSGPGLDALLRDLHLPATGTYTIEVRSSFLTGFGTTGPYTLRLTAAATVKVDLLDPVPDLLEELTQTPEQAKVNLAQHAATVRGVAADGVARVVVRVRVSDPGTVELTLVDDAGVPLAPAEEAGFLTQLGGAIGSNSLSVSTVEVPAEGPMALAVYQAPSTFVRAGSGDVNERERNISLRVRFTPQTGGAPQEAMTPITIARPPVVLVHGIWGSPASWNGFFPLLSAPIFTASLADYEESNARGLDVNTPIVAAQLKQAVARFKTAEQVAAIQADVVTHSMGGLLVRGLPLLGEDYFRADNFQQGDVHKLINIGSAHFGSELAARLRTKVNNFRCRTAFSIADARIHEGAIHDLSPGSTGLREINQVLSPLRLHNNVGIASERQKEVNASGVLIRAVQSPLVCGRILPPGDFDAVFHDDNDLLVSVSSQRARLSPTSPAVSTFASLIHTRASGVFDIADGAAELESEEVSREVINLLNLAVDDGKFIRLLPP